MGRQPSSIAGTFMLWGCTFFLAGYFIMHGLGFGGERGFLSLERLDGEIAVSEASLNELQEYRQWLDHRVQLVSQDKVDADLLGELARNQGGLFAADEIIIDLN